MARSRYFLLFLLLIFLQQRTSKAQIDELTPGLDVLGDLNKFTTIGVKLVYMFNKIGKGLSNKPDPIFESIKVINKKLDALSSDLSRFQSLLFKKLDHIERKNDLTNKMSQLVEKINTLDSYYNEYVDQQDPQKRVLQDDRDELVRKIKTLDHDGIKRLLDTLKEVLVDQYLGNQHPLIELLADKRLDSELMCPARQSAQQIIYNLYKKIALTELRGYVLLSYATRVQRIKAGWDEKSVNEELPTDPMYKRLTAIQSKVKELLESTDRGVYKCDPDEHIIDRTYTKFGPVLQGYLIYEEDTTFEVKGRTDGACWYECKDKGVVQINTDTKHHRLDKLMEKQKMCNGNLRDCTSISPELRICFSDKETGGRIYDFIKTKDDDYLGPSKRCNSSTYYRKSRGDDIFGILPMCDYCFCTCDESKEKPQNGNYGNNRFGDIREISLLDLTSDANKNFVVTGFRFEFILAHRLIIRLKLGELLPNATIGREKWDDLGQTHRRSMEPNSPIYKITYDQRTILLDDLEAPANHVLTGMKFEKVENYIQLKIRVTPFDYATGKLDPEKSYWRMNEKPPKMPHRYELDLNNTDIPTLFTNEPDSQNNQYLNITLTDKDKDLSQNLVPFIDLQTVEHRPPVALSGAGLIHKGTTNSGGFLALKLFTYNFYNNVYPKERDIYYVNK